MPIEAAHCLGRHTPTLHQQSSPPHHHVVALAGRRVRTVHQDTGVEDRHADAVLISRGATGAFLRRVRDCERLRLALLRGQPCARTGSCELAVEAVEEECAVLCAVWLHATPGLGRKRSAVAAQEADIEGGLTNRLSEQLSTNREGRMEGRRETAQGSRDSEEYSTSTARRDRRRNQARIGRD